MRTPSGVRHEGCRGSFPDSHSATPGQVLSSSAEAVFFTASAVKACVSSVPSGSGGPSLRFGPFRPVTAGTPGTAKGRLLVSQNQGYPWIPRGIQGLRTPSPGRLNRQLPGFLGF